MGRRREYASRAEQAKAYRKRKKEQQPFKPLAREFVAIDGEGQDTPEGKHIYTVLSASDGSYVFDPAGLSTYVCLDYLIKLRQRHPKAVLCGFYFNYDINMILANVPRERLERLRQFDAITFDDPRQEGRKFKIEWVQGKWLNVWAGSIELDPDTFKYRFVPEDKGAKVYDVKGFFQTSFVNVLKEWKVGTPEQQALIQSMKEQRADFENVDPKQVHAYNLLECELLVKVMEKLQDAVNAAEIPLRDWHGAGAMASALLRKYGVKSHVLAEPPEATDAVTRAYFGGRIQLLQMGEHNAGAYSHDVNSAYPSVCQDLPSLKGKWQRVNGYTGHKWGCWRVKWSLPDDTLITPFPVRDKDGCIYYPYAGEGYYWTPEVEVALKHYGASIEVLEGWLFHPSTEVKPFGFIPELYELRRQYKKAGNLAHIPIKLGLNSLYGKTAESKPYRGKDRPTYQSFTWAGYITSGTRAKLLDLALSDPSSVIAFATDGVYTTRPLCSDTDGLGGWEVEQLQDFFIVQPGVYLYHTMEGKTKIKVRGFRPSECNFDELRQEWRKRGVFGRVTIQTRRFIGLKLALMAKDFATWQTWPSKTKDIKFMTRKGRLDVLGQSLQPVVRLYPIEPLADISAPFGKAVLGSEDRDQWRGFALDDQPDAE